MTAPNTAREALAPFASPRLTTDEDGDALEMRGRDGQLCLPDSHGFQLTWADENDGDTVHVTAGQIRRARAAYAALSVQPTREGLREPFIAVLTSLAAAISLLEDGGRIAAASDKIFQQMLADYRKALEEGRAALAAAPMPVETGWQDIASLPDTDEMVIAGRTADGAQLVWRASILYRQVHGKTPAHLSFYPTHWKRLDPLPSTGEG